MTPCLPGVGGPGHSLSILYIQGCAYAEPQGSPNVNSALPFHVEFQSQVPCIRVTSPFICLSLSPHVCLSLQISVFLSRAHNTSTHSHAHINTPQAAPFAQLKTLRLRIYHICIYDAYVCTVHVTHTYITHTYIPYM